VKLPAQEIIIWVLLLINVRCCRFRFYESHDFVLNLKGQCHEIFYTDGKSAGVNDIGALQIILDLCIPEKELAKTRSQISFT
jgi:hypothetical protein